MDQNSHGPILVIGPTAGVAEEPLQITGRCALADLQRHHARSRERMSFNWRKYSQIT